MVKDISKRRSKCDQWEVRVQSKFHRISSSTIFYQLESSLKAFNFYETENFWRDQSAANVINKLYHNYATLK